MHSILFHIGPLPIYSYGFMLMLAFLAATAIATHLARERGMPPEYVLDLTAISWSPAILGARLLYVSSPGATFRDHLDHVLRVWEGGLSFHGGLVGGLLVGCALLPRPGHLLPADGRRRRARAGARLRHRAHRLFPERLLLWRADRSSLGLPLPRPADHRAATPPSHPTQLYASIINLGIFALLMLISAPAACTGQVLWSYLLFYAIYRFGIEFLRKGATAQVLAAGLTHSQWASIGMVLVAGAVLSASADHGQGLPISGARKLGSGTQQPTS